MAFISNRFLPKELICNDEGKLTPHAYLILLLVCLAFFLPGFFTLPPVDRDEPHFAQASKQMVQSGDYVDIHFQDKPRYNKPIGIYWLQASAVWLVGKAHLNDIWPYRLPSLAGAILAVLFTALTGTALFGAMAGFLAALLLASCLVLNVEARLAKTDAMLLACVMCCQYALAVAYMARDKVQNLSWHHAALFWGAAAAGFLIKGPIVLLVIGSTLLGLRLSGHPVKWFKKLYPWQGLVFWLALTTPWYVAILIASHGHFAAQSGGHDLLGKIWQGQDRGLLPPGLHFLALPAVFFPASLVVLLALPDAFLQRRNAAVAFCVAWVMPAWIVFELSLTKLPHYVLPLYPALAILGAKFMLDGFPALTNPKLKFWPPLVISVWMVVAFGLALSLGLLPNLLGETADALQLIAGLALVASCGAVVYLLLTKNGEAIFLLCLSCLVFYAYAFGTTLPNLRHIWLSAEAMSLIRQTASCPSPEIGTLSYNEPSLVFLSPEKVTNFATPQALAHFMQSHGCMMALIDTRRREEFLAGFEKMQPQRAGEISGPNLGNSKHKILELYRLPPAEKAIP